MLFFGQFSVDIFGRCFIFSLVNAIAVQWWLAGKNSFNRWRGWRDSWAVFMSRGPWLLPDFRLGLSRWDGV